MHRQDLLEEEIAKVVQGLGYTYVGLQRIPQGKYSLIRLYIDKPGGVTIDDCALVSRQVDAVMEVKSPIQGEYTLEVSSPGLDRLLFTAEQFREQLGKTVSIRLLVPIEGRRNFKGVLDSVLEEGVSIRVDDERVELRFADISEARLVPEW